MYLALWAAFAVAYHDVQEEDTVRLIMESLVALDRTSAAVFATIERRVRRIGDVLGFVRARCWEGPHGNMVLDRARLLQG